MNVVLESSAHRDFSEAFEWYRAHGRRGVARRFHKAVNSAIAKIGGNYLVYVAGYGGYRQCPVDGFPYELVFKEEASRLAVIRIYHTSRDPSGWQQYVEE